MVGLVTLVVLVHGFALSRTSLMPDGELHLFGLGGLGTLFAALLGALAITTEFRTGTIRPTFLTMPRRNIVLLAKACTAAVAGAGYGVAAGGLAIGLGSVALAARGISSALSSEDYAQLVLGDAAGAALWAVIGLCAGALIRNQVTTVLTVAAWILFVEPVLLGQIPEVIRFFPASAAAAISGSTIGGETPGNVGLLAPAAGFAVIIGYAVLALAAALRITERRDVP